MKALKRRTVITISRIRDELGIMRQTIPSALGLVWKSSPGWTLVNALLVIVQGILPLASVYLIKVIVDAVASGAAAPDRAALVPRVMLLVALAGAVSLMGFVCKSLSSFASDSQSLIMTDTVSHVLHAQSIAVDLAYYEDPDYYNTMQRAQQEAPTRPTKILADLVQIAQNAISLSAIAVLILAFSWAVGLVLFAAAIPAALVRVAYSRKRFKFERKQAETERQAWYYHWMLTNSYNAKEVRLLDLGGVFIDRYKQLRRKLFQGRQRLSMYRLAGDVISQAIVTAAIFGAFAVISYQAIGGAITMGDLVMYFLGFQMGMGYLQSILGSLAGLYEDSLFLTDYYRFMGIRPSIVVPADPAPLPPGRGIAFRSVSFTYSGSKAEALHGIDLTIPPGQVVAIVGENGSGKTTLIKLLCRLYDPTAGSIAVDGTDLRRIDPARWRKEIAVVFQDYVHYYMSARENIWVGDITLEPGDGRVVEAARRSGADRVIRRLPGGYESVLGRWFAEGSELSVGEWQKVALSRAFLRDAGIIVLDEPTSALDALAEAELFEQFRSLIRGKTVVLISHRFSTVKMADYIYVMERGRVVEQGMHANLMRLDGKYARMYRAQAENYNEEPPVTYAEAGQVSS